MKAPMLRIHTIAAGGGSLCRFDGFRLTVGPESGAVGCSLLELDLRARTGTTVVAIYRQEASMTLPTGQERLEPGDKLILIGAEEAVEQARALLAEGAPDVQARSETDMDPGAT